MPAPDPSPDAARWETIAAWARTQEGTPSQTIEPPASDPGDGQHVTPSSAAGLELHEVLGEGGMGVVRRATQRSIGRTVAVKTLRDARHTPETARKLLAEAWVTGHLEHPNIVPVYDIATEEDRPLIVLKRVEGEPWARLLVQPELSTEFVDEHDLLDAHLRILDQVCRALHFAHTQGVVHLDLKPDNVMLGRHGEVYLLDWGVAMALDDDARGQLPRAGDHRGIVGTPSYMAPEMLEGDGRLLDARTDVYLLGATLFEVLAGHPPHRGETIMEVLHSALTDEPALPDDTPAELAAICRRAMARAPTDRYPNAEAMRQALLDFGRHRESARAAQRAAERLELLEAALDRGAAVGRQLHALFAQARFGFEQALDSWPDNEAAAAGLARAFAVVIEFELRHDDPQVAAALAREAPSLPDELRRRVDEATSRHKANLDELASRRRDLDVRIGQRTRAFVISVFGVLWTVLPAIEFFTDPKRSDAEAFAQYASVPALSLLALTGLAVWARESLTRTQVNRMVLSAMFTALLAHLMLLAGLAALGLPPTLNLVLMLPVWMAITIPVALAVDRRALPIPITFGAGFFVAVSRPELAALIVALCNLVFTVTLVVIWWPERFRGPIPEPDHRG